MSFNHLIVTQAKATPLYLFATRTYQNWVTSQDETVQLWLGASGYEGEGPCIKYQPNGHIEAVYAGVDDIGDYFAAGDLCRQLPKGDYRLEGVAEDSLFAAAVSWALGAYRYERYKADDTQLARLVLPSQSLVDKANKMIAAICRVRDLVNTPASDMMPEHLGAEVEALAKHYDADVTQLVGDELLQHNYPCIHAVGRGSTYAPRLIDLRWGNTDHPAVTLVGKGVCFDSGGINFKPSNIMRLMKKDMGGAAQVIGLAELIMSHKLPVQLRVLIPTVENAVGPGCYLTGDVLTARNGTTIEVTNTDAEGRLLLCDVLHEASSEKPELLVDFATLTGACRIGLGTELPGLFSPDQTLAGDLLESGSQVDDNFWQLPLYRPYEDLLKSDIADCVNCQESGPYGGAIVAALFLQKFVDPDISWAHFDLMAWNIRSLPGRPVGGEAQCIRAVFEYLQRRFT